jgi:hypothetical protein
MTVNLVDNRSGPAISNDTNSTSPRVPVVSPADTENSRAVKKPAVGAGWLGVPPQNYAGRRAAIRSPAEITLSAERGGKDAPLTVPPIPSLAGPAAARGAGRRAVTGVRDGSSLDKAIPATGQALNAASPDELTARARGGAYAPAQAPAGGDDAQIGPIVDAYNKLMQCCDNSDNGLVQSVLDSMPAVIELRTAIVKSLTDAANQAGTDPKARAQAITARALYIEAAGPQDGNFESLVDLLNYNLQVQKPAGDVADAYAKGGAEAAAQALKAATQSVGNPYYAAEIIQQSADTIGKITKDMNSVAGSLQGSEPFQRIYTNLSQSVEAANPVAVSSSLSPRGKAAADLVANSIAGNAPLISKETPFTDGGWHYCDAARHAITNGDGAALSLALAAALKGKSTGLALEFAGYVAQAIQDLTSRASSDFKAFATTTLDLHDLRKIWGPAMDEHQLTAAINGYRKDHPDIEKNADEQLSRLSQDGDAIAQVASAINGYRAQLDGVHGAEELFAAAKSLTNDGAAAVAISQSGKAADAAFRVAVAAELPSAPGGGSAVQAFMASWPMGWKTAKSLRTYVSAKLGKKYDQAVKAGETPSPLPAIGISAAGFLLNVQRLSVSSPSPLKGTVQRVSAGLGFGKYATELIAELSTVRIGQNIAKHFPGFTVDNGNLYFDNGVKKIGLASLLDSTSYRLVRGAYYGAGAVGSFLAAWDEFEKGDKFTGVLYALGGLNSSVYAAKGPVARGLGRIAGKEAAGEAISTVSTVAGLTIFGALLVYDGVKRVREVKAFHRDTSNFLQRGLGLTPEVADAFSESGSSGDFAAAALQAFAHQYNMSYGQLLQKLDREPIDKVRKFILAAVNMRGGPDYAASLPTDAPPPRLGRPDWRVQSLRELRYYADYLFGPNKLN